MGIKQEKAYKNIKCGGGGIGRHARLRIWCREMWEFESPARTKVEGKSSAFFVLNRP